ncbi:MAG: winged helix-turn-helix domain-containing protein [Candidatus Aenigmatarchaeota archaeon]
MKKQANDLFKLLSDDSKLRIVKFLLENEGGSCSDLSSFINKDLSTTFRHIENLRKNKLVTTKKQGRYLLCSIKNKEALRNLLSMSKEIGD